MSELYEHKPSEAELKIMAEQFGFRFNTVGAYQRDLAGDWAIILAPRLARRRVTWMAKLDRKSRTKQWIKGFDCPSAAAELAFAKWRTWVNKPMA